jgi:hypothetical protein
MKQLITVTPYGAQSAFLRTLFNDISLSNEGKTAQLTLLNLVEMIDRTKKGYSTKDINSFSGDVSILYKGELKMKIKFKRVQLESNKIQRDLEDQIKEEKLR